MSDEESDPEPQEVVVDDLDAFKRVFRRHAAGVAAVTALDANGKPVGFTATSLASLAAVPPLATFNMAQVASAWPAMTVGNHVAIHTLGPRTRYLAEKLAADNSLRFVGDHWKPGLYGVAILQGVTSWMLGQIIEVHPVHNNAVIIVQIETGALGPEDEALLYHERSYRSPGNVV
jgi:flavin reductase (DIM6/NTAB) family NADH-FMN oxidoreductase RutF